MRAMRSVVGVGTASGVSAQMKVGSMEDWKEKYGNETNSWLKQLSEEAENENAPKHRSREVKDGHYVLVPPTPLKDPKLILLSRELAEDMKVPADDEAFVKFFSGDTSAFRLGAEWATPYALSIMGQEMYSNCPFGNGNGYGDGRAVSIGEVVVEKKRFEMQLKGGGRTPFCRGADGRAVLRSSIREFLASEASFFLGVPTTRALCLIQSGSETVKRPWYSKETSIAPITEDDPRLAQFPAGIRKQLAQQYNAQQGRDPDRLVNEPTAITTRVASSFCRIGHIDLFARRAAQEPDSDFRQEQLRQIVAHCIFREDTDLWKESFLHDEHNAIQSHDFKAAVLQFARNTCDRLANLAAQWLRVGYCQGNFNADNCHIGGITLDYGPMGYMEKYDRGFAKWVGSGDHFAFAAQPRAAQANFATLARSLLPLFNPKEDSEYISQLRALVEEYSPKAFQKAVDATFFKKLGLESPDSSTQIWKDLEPLLQEYQFDYTLFFRELSENPLTITASQLFQTASYTPLSDRGQSALDTWLRTWRSELPTKDNDTLSQRMMKANPKYVLRESMFVHAYEAAMAGDFSLVNELYDLIKKPYTDQGPEMNAKFYKKADEADFAKAGTAFMT